MLEKLKSFLANDTLFYGALLILVAIGSFGLGRLSALDTKKTEKPLISKEFIGPAAVVETSTSTSVGKEASTTSVAAKKPVVVVGSKTGTKYHLPECPGAKRIKPSNLISFESIEAAKAAGYTAASNCPGLQ